MPTERTFALIKPDIVATRWIGEVIARIERIDLAVIAMRMQRLTQADLDFLYREHRARSFFADLCAFMQEAPVVAMVLEGENAIAAYRAIMGSTDSKLALRGTIRCSYGGKPDAQGRSPIYRNAVHGSDGADAAQREIRQFFPELA